MGKAIIELVSTFITISGNETIDTILFFLIGVINFSVGWDFVSGLFDFLGFYDSQLMSDVHWTVRVIVFVLLTFILVKVFQFLAWLLSFPWWVYLILLLLLVIGVVVIYYYNYRKRLISDNGNENNVKSATEHIENTSVPTKSYNKFICPRCNSTLIGRTGRYGKFVGCNSFPKCTYSRKRF